jgi:VWFA-related protein
MVGAESILCCAYVSIESGGVQVGIELRMRWVGMHWILIAVLAAWMATPSWAAKRITVAQLEQLLSAESGGHKTDAEIARKISGVELSERLTETTLARLNQQLPSGSAAATALLLLADRSAFLDPPANELPSTLAPDAATQQRLLAAAQRFALETLPRLPNLLATRTTFSFDDSPQEGPKGGYAERMGMHLIGSSQAEVSVSNEKENVSIKSGAAQAAGGLMTWGEFGSALLIILSDSAQGKTTWSHWEQTSAGMMAVFHYDVPKSASHYEIDTSVEEIQNSGESIRWAGARARDAGAISKWNRTIRVKPDYQGTLWIDPATGTITRVTLIADLNGNPKFERGAVLVEYGPVAIGDKTLICPVRSLALSAAPPTVNATFAGVATEWLNENLFTNYHLFASTARIVNEEAVGAAPAASVPSTATAAGAERTQGAPVSPSPVTGSQAAQVQTAPTTPVAQQEASPLAAGPAKALVAMPVEKVETQEAVVAGTPEQKPSESAAPTAAPVQTSSVSPPETPAATAPTASPPDSGVTLHVNVDVLLVPVVVHDKQDRAVGDLTEKDFTVIDQGKPRPVTGFTVVRSEVQREAGQANESQAPGEAATAPASGQNRFVVFLFDDRHLETSDLARTQQAALQVLDKPLAANEYAAVVSLMGVNSGITQDRALLEAAVKKVAVHQSFQHDSRDCPDIDYFSANKILNQHDETEFQIAVAKADSCIGIVANAPGSSTGMAEIENATAADQRLALSAARRSLSVGEEDARESLNAVATVERAISKLSGQRTLILMSPGFLTLSPDTMSFKSQLFDQAAASNVIINTLDARGLYAGNVDASQGGSTVFLGQLTGQTSQNHLNAMRESENALSEMANGTGGTYFHNNNDLGSGLASLMAPPEFEYLLEISLKDVKPTGTYHALQVKVDRADVHVQARHGYFAPKEPRKP